MIKMFEDNRWLNLKIELMLTYSSPPRPPDINVVCMILSSISSVVGYGTIYVDACVALWRYLASIYVPNEEEIWLYSFQQNLEFAIDRRWLELWINNHVLTLTKSGVRLSSSACSKNRLIMVYCMCTLTRSGFFVKTEACCFEALLIFIGVSSKWLDIHVRFGSQSYVSREGELTMIIVDWIIQRHHILLRNLSTAQVYDIVKSLYKEDAKPVVKPPCRNRRWMCLY
ncbi:hypothetical protein ISN44_As13g030860 [Arabidopsis suecica]|uniref:Uncharacterized protein n=1 Tax=Arabidopsis suecica TaxID=45249 RepID=A0A8T1XWW0_ARASU|nr:hypothetical protein ISN44_As13g030860 [Arabidopsis suecica]